MTFSKEQVSEFEALSRPLIKFLNDNCHPHVTVILTADSSEICEGVAAIRTADYIKD